METRGEGEARGERGEMSSVAGREQRRGVMYELIAYVPVTARHTS